MHHNEAAPQSNDQKTDPGSDDPLVRRDSLFEEKDSALRRDVHALGALIGNLLVEQGSEELYNAVEKARRLAIQARESADHDSAELARMVDDLSPRMARDLIRGFSTYFQLVNSAEQVHRIRRRRDYLKDSLHRQPGAFDDTLQQLKESGMSLEECIELLSKLEITPVFTAHPTETTRRTLLRKQQTIVRRMVEMQNPALTPHEANACFESIRSDITSIWQTEENPSEAANVSDELEHMLFFLTDVIYKVIPSIYEAIHAALIDIYGPEAKDYELPTLFRFASWVGGDLSSSKEITARTIRETMARQRSLILDLYYRESLMLAEKLSQSESRVGVDSEVKKRILNYSGQFPRAHGSVPHRYRDMPYRLFLRLITERLQSTYDDDVFPYESAEQFIDDLQVIATSLENHRGEHAGLFLVKRLIRRAQTFGFYFTTLDIRQNAKNIQALMGRCLGQDDWATRPAEERLATISHALVSHESPDANPDNETKRTLAIFQAISFCRRRYGRNSIGSFIVSNCHGEDDVMATVLLALWGDLRRQDGTVPIDVAPLFETVDELAHGPGIVRRLLQNPVYRKHLETQNNHQTVMIGNSEHSTEGSFMSSRWALQWAKNAIVDIFDQTGVHGTIFHGRSGPAARDRKAESVSNGRLRATENGEAVNARYGVRGIAARTLEKTFSMVALTTGRPDRPDPQDRKHWSEVMNVASVNSRGSYRKLVFETENFHEYFRLATPVDVIERLRLGTNPIDIDHNETSSMPAGRQSIPWGFAWNQSRHMLPAWYGLGTGLTAATDEFGLETLQEMTRAWPFFSRLMIDAETALAIADLDIAENYSLLAGPLHEQFFPLIKTEFAIANELVLAIRGQKRLLQNNKTLRRSIRLRNPYVDPMSLLQVELLKRWRNGGRKDDELLDALLASVNGIARGLQAG